MSKRFKETDKEKLKEAWKKYIRDGIVPHEQIRSCVLDSWARCREMKVDPFQKKAGFFLEPEQFKKLLAKKQRLIDLCMPHMEALYDFVQSSGFIIALTDENGVILKILGDKDIQDRIAQGGFIEGAAWCEENAGTNGIGTALAIKHPCQLYSYEHYCLFAQISTGSCAPIQLSDGQIIGSITLVGYDYNIHKHTLGMAVAVSSAIRNSVELQKAQWEVKLKDSYKKTIIDSIYQSVLAVDPQGLITFVNAYALKLLHLRHNVDEYVGRSLLRILPAGNDDLKDIIENRLERTDREITIYTTGGNEMCNITSRIINANENDFGSMVLIMDNVKRVRKIARQMTGAVASITFDDLLGKSQGYLETLKMARNAAQSDSNVLLLGESGTGKDVFAQAIHNESLRRNGPFVVINCSAIPKELIASELFGYVEGAFTGARRGGSPGKFEFADTGTIFLDEIGDMPIDLQGHLLRVIEDRKVLRIGGHDTIPVDVRIIAATNCDIQEDIKSGRFRNDLFYRLNVITINMVPLRERLDDLEGFIHLFNKKLTGNLKIPPHEITEGYIQCLKNYHFPGNIRELQNIVERSIIMSTNGMLSPSCLVHEVIGRTGTAPILEEKQSNLLDKNSVYQLLLKNNGNISKTAKEIGVARSTLYRKMDRYGFTKTILR